MKNFYILTSSLLLLSSACVPYRDQSNADKVGASGLTSLEFNLPDPSSIAANASQHLTHIQIKLSENICDKITQQCIPQEIKNEMIPYTKNSKFPELSLNQGSDYNLYIAVGKSKQANEQDMDDSLIYYESSGGDGFIPADSFKGMAKLQKKFYLKLTSAGKELGLPETKKSEAETNTPPQIQNQVPPVTPTPPIQTPPVNQTSLKAFFSTTKFATASNPNATIKDAWGKARYLIVDFSFYGCPPCRRLMTTLNTDSGVITALEKSGKCKFVTAAVHEDAIRFRNENRNISSHIHSMDGSIPGMLDKFSGSKEGNIPGFPHIRIYDSQKNGGDVIHKEVGTFTFFQESRVKNLCL